MKLTIKNLEQIKAWTPPGNIMNSPIVHDIVVNPLTYDYVFKIRFQGKEWHVEINRDVNYYAEHNGFEITLQRVGDGDPHTTWIFKNQIENMREFYDNIHAMLYRITQNTFKKYYIQATL
jgi:hypothetical protein